MLAQAKASRGAQLAAWIRAVLLHHTAYLMAAPGVQPVLAALYQVHHCLNQQHMLNGELSLGGAASIYK